MLTQQPSHHTRYCLLVATIVGLLLALIPPSGAPAQAATDGTNAVPAAEQVASQARADCTVPPGWTEAYYDESGKLVTVTRCPGDEDDGGGGGGGGGGEPTCEYYELFNEFCEGQAACWSNDPAAIEDPPELEGVPKPEPDSHAAYTRCRNPDGSIYDRYYWSTQTEEPPLEEQALEAFGLLAPPDFTLAFSPPGRTYVNLQTWWWADGATSEEITGSSAFGVVAIGTPDHIEVDPGDGSGIQTCDWSTSNVDTCSYAYTRASVDGSATADDGSPAYTARARLVYTVRFENNGEPLELPGLPDRLESPWEETTVPVGEIQSIIQ